jgi:hypothetical protein
LFYYSGIRLEAYLKGTRAKYLENNLPIAGCGLSYQYGFKKSWIVRSDEGNTDNYSLKSEFRNHFFGCYIFYQKTLSDHIKWRISLSAEYNRLLNQPHTIIGGQALIGEDEILSRYYGAGLSNGIYVEYKKCLLGLSLKTSYLLMDNHTASQLGGNNYSFSERLKNWNEWLLGIQVEVVPVFEWGRKR